MGSDELLDVRWIKKDVAPNADRTELPRARQLEHPAAGPRLETRRGLVGCKKDGAGLLGLDGWPASAGRRHVARSTAGRPAAVPRLTNSSSMPERARGRGSCRNREGAVARGGGVLSGWVGATCRAHEKHRTVDVQRTSSTARGGRTSPNVALRWVWPVEADYLGEVI